MNRRPAPPVVLVVLLLAGCGGSQSFDLPADPEPVADKFIQAFVAMDVARLQELAASRRVRVELSRLLPGQDEYPEDALRRYFLGSTEAGLAEVSVVAISQDSPWDRQVVVTFEYRVERPGTLEEEEIWGERSFELSRLNGKWWVSRLPAPDLLQPADPLDPG